MRRQLGVVAVALAIVPGVGAPSAGQSKRIGIMCSALVGDDGQRRIECGEQFLPGHDLFAKYQKGFPDAREFRVLARSVIYRSGELVLEDVTIRVDGVVLTAAASCYDKATRQFQFEGPVRLTAAAAPR